MKLVLLVSGLLSLTSPSLMAAESFDWGRGVEGREQLVEGVPVADINLLNQVGVWKGLSKSQIPTLGGKAGIGNGRVVFPDSSDGRVRNSGMQLALEKVSGDFSIELEMSLGQEADRARGLDGFYFGLFDESTEKNLLVNKEKDLIWFRINPLGVVTAHFSANGEHYTQKTNVIFPVRETIRLKFGIQGDKLALQYLKHGHSEVLLEVNFRDFPELDAMALNAVGVNSLEVDSISWSGIVPRPGEGVVKRELDLSAPRFLQQSYVYREVGDRSYQLEAFMPYQSTRDELLPAIIFFHGGSWKSGNRSAFYNQCRELAEAGMIAISADYRTKSRDDVEPIDAVRDAKEAMRWVKSNAHHLGIDPERIAAGGGSAGGQLALSLALDTSIDVAEPRNISTRPDALVLFNPVLDTGPDGFANHLVKDYWEAFSPYHQLKSGMPPMLIMIGDQDNVSPPDMVQAFVARARSLGNEVTGEMYPGKKHGFFNRGYSDDGYDLTIARAKKFLSAHGFLR